VIAGDRKAFSQKVAKDIAEWSVVVEAVGVKSE
jgi:hypothetical protein